MVSYKLLLQCHITKVAMWQSQECRTSTVQCLHKTGWHAHSLEVHQSIAGILHLYLMCSWNLPTRKARRETGSTCVCCCIDSTQSRFAHLYHITTSFSRERREMRAFTSRLQFNHRACSLGQHPIGFRARTFLPNGGRRSRVVIYEGLVVVHQPFSSRRDCSRGVSY